MANKPPVPGKPAAPAAPVQGTTTSKNTPVVQRSNPTQNIAPTANTNVSNRPPQADPTAHSQPHNQMRKRRGGTV